MQQAKPRILIELPRRVSGRRRPDVSQSFFRRPTTFSHRRRISVVRLRARKLRLAHSPDLTRKASCQPFIRTKRLSRLIGSLQELNELGVGFVSLSEALDLTTASGRALAGMLAAFAEFEPDILRDRVKAGIAQARQ